MKLTTQQTDKIRAFLDSQNLNFQEFYDEMLDHLILETEARMENEQIEFKIAFFELIEDLNWKYHRPYDFLTNQHETRGIKTIEELTIKARFSQSRVSFFKRLLGNLAKPFSLLSLLLVFAFWGLLQGFAPFQVSHPYVFGILNALSWAFTFQYFLHISPKKNWYIKGVSKLFFGMRNNRQLFVFKEVWVSREILFSFGLYLLTVNLLHLFNREVEWYWMMLCFWFASIVLYTAFQDYSGIRSKLKTT